MTMGREPSPPLCRRSGSDASAFSASASSTSGLSLFATSSWMNTVTSGPSAEAGAGGNDVLLEIEDRARARQPRPFPSAVSSSGTVMYSAPIAATIGCALRGVATLTSPAPDRSAPTAARCAAPVLPREPAMTSTCP